MIVPTATTGSGVARIVTDTQALLLHVGDSHQLEPNLTDAAGSPVSAVLPLAYVSRDPSVASVSTTGLVSAAEPGTTVIYARYTLAGNTFEQEVKVTICPPYPQAQPFYTFGLHQDPTSGTFVGADRFGTGTWDGTTWTPAA